MISGIEVARPIRISDQLPLAAAAMATTLSRLMTRSAMAMVRTAPQMLLEFLDVLFLAVLDQQLDGDPEQQNAADQLSHG